VRKIIVEKRESAVMLIVIHQREEWLFELLCCPSLWELPGYMPSSVGWEQSTVLSTNLLENTT